MQNKARSRSTWTKEQKDQQNKRIYESYKVVGCKLQRPIADAFTAYAKETGTTVNALLSNFIMGTLDAAGMLPDPKPPADPAQDQE